MLLKRTFGFTVSCYCSCTTSFRTPLHLLDLLLFSIDLVSQKLARQCHAQILAQGFQQNAFLTTRLISAYATCGSLTKSRLVFDSIEVKNVFIWNSLINGYVKNNGYNDAFNLFCEMCCNNVFPDYSTLATLSKVSGVLEDFVSRKLIHGKSITIGFALDTIAANSVMSMYCKCGELGECRKLFDEMPHRNVGSRDVVIAGCVASENCASDKDLWDFFRMMLDRKV